MDNGIGGFVLFFHFPVPSFNNVHCFFLRRPRDAPWTEKEKFIEMIRNDPNTLNLINPESWIWNIYESASVTVAPTPTI